MPEVAWIDKIEYKGKQVWTVYKAWGIIKFESKIKYKATYLKSGLIRIRMVLVRKIWLLSACFFRVKIFLESGQRKSRS